LFKGMPDNTLRLDFMIVRRLARAVCRLDVTRTLLVETDMRITRWAILILLLTISILSATAGPSAAQTVLRLDQLQVDLWPEYDQPDVLVIYRGILSPETPLPAAVTLRLPLRVGEPTAVAHDDGTGGLFNVPYSTQVEGEWLAVTLETPTLNFQLEFYDRLTLIGEQRNYTFVWPGDYAVGQLGFMLLPPPGATEIQTEPALSLVQLDEDDRSYRGTMGDLVVGQEARLTISYYGGGVSLAVEDGDDDANTSLIVGVVIAALLVLAVGGVWYYVRQSSPPPAPVPLPPQRKRPKRSRSQRRRDSGARRQTDKVGARDVKPSSGAHCVHCGHPLGGKDRFCGSCGKPV